MTHFDLIESLEKGAKIIKRHFLNTFRDSPCEPLHDWKGGPGKFLHSIITKGLPEREKQEQERKLIALFESIDWRSYEHKPSVRVLHYANRPYRDYHALVII